MTHFVRIRFFSFIQTRLHSLLRPVLLQALCTDHLVIRVGETQDLVHLVRCRKSKEVASNVGVEPTEPRAGGNKFHGQAVKDIFVLELFAGTARLTKCFGRKGFKAMAFDKTNKRSEGQSVIEYDLSNTDEVDSLISFISTHAEQIALIHFAPPCGTASRARGKRLRFLKDHGIKEPRPLRDDVHPDGFAHLQGSDKLRTELANLLYENTVRIAQAAIEMHVAVTIENPTNSLMWKTSPFVNLFSEHPELTFVTFHNCAHGGARDKLTSFATNVSWFQSLELRCDGQHTHAPWTPTIVAGQVHYPTHTEAAYPETLCQRIVSIVYDKVLELGATETETLDLQAQAPGKSMNRVVMGALPRGKHVKPLVSIFGEYINLILAPQSNASELEFLAKLPRGSAVQSRHLTTWGSLWDAMDKQVRKRLLAVKLGDLKKQLNKEKFDQETQFVDYLQFFKQLGCVENSNFKLALDVSALDESSTCERVVIGVPREPIDFLERAVKAGHPRSVAINLPPDLCNVMDWNRTADAYDIYKHRIEFVKLWSHRAAELKAEDERMLERAPQHLRHLLRGKRLAVWQSMLEHYAYPDVTLVEDIVSGFAVTGWLPDSGIFPKEFRPPSMDVSTLQAISKGVNQHVKAKVLAAACSELSGQTWEETTKELSEGWMELDKGGGSNSAWAMRFGLQQKDKIRVIDDFSVANVNQTVGLHERLKIFGIDDIAALLAYSLDAAGDEDHPQLLGKTIDLRSAYKQFGICSADRSRTRVATSDPTTQTFILLMVNALPFGATGSVAAFLRISMFIWYIGVIGLKLAWTAFYDDYTVLSRVDCAPNAAWGAECLFDLLGVVFAREGKKATVFDRTFNSLGVIFDLNFICQGLVSIGHTEARRLELVETINNLLEDRVVSAKSLERLRGRLLWFENFICGRQANFLVARLSKFMNEEKYGKSFYKDLRSTLDKLLVRVSEGKPIQITRQVLDTWTCFTDGACETSCSVGGLLVNPAGSEVSSVLVERLYKESKHPIYEVELIPLLVAVTLWGSLFEKAKLRFMWTMMRPEQGSSKVQERLAWLMPS